MKRYRITAACYYIKAALKNKSGLIIKPKLNCI